MMNSPWSDTNKSTSD